MRTVPSSAAAHHCRPVPTESLRLPVAAPESVWERVARVCRLRSPLQAKALRYSLPLTTINLRTGLMQAPEVLGAFMVEMRAALDEPLEGRRPFAELLGAVIEEDADGDRARAYLLQGESQATLERFIREGTQELGALMLAISEAKARLALMKGRA